MWHVYYSMFVKVCVGHPRCPWPAKSQTDLPLSPLCQLRWNFDQWQRFTPVKSDGYLSDLDMCQIDNLCTDYINSSEMKGKLSGKYVGLCRCTHTHTLRGLSKNNHFPVINSVVSSGNLPSHPLARWWNYRSRHRQDYYWIWIWIWIWIWWWWLNYYDDDDDIHYDITVVKS